MFRARAAADRGSVVAAQPAGGSHMARLRPDAASGLCRGTDVHQGRKLVELLPRSSNVLRREDDQKSRDGSTPYLIPPSPGSALPRLAALARLAPLALLLLLAAGRGSEQGRRWAAPVVLRSLAARSASASGWAAGVGHAVLNGPREERRRSSRLPALSALRLRRSAPPRRAASARAKRRNAVAAELARIVRRTGPPLQKAQPAVPERTHRLLSAPLSAPERRGFSRRLLTPPHFKRRFLRLRSLREKGETPSRSFTSTGEPATSNAAPQTAGQTPERPPTPETSGPFANVRREPTPPPFRAKHPPPKMFRAAFGGAPAPRSPLPKRLTASSGKHLLCSRLLSRFYGREGGSVVIGTVIFEKPSSVLQ